MLDRPRARPAIASPDWVDWVAKERLVDGYRERHGLAPGDARLKALDLQYHDLRAERSLCRPRRAGARSSTDAEVERGDDRAADDHPGLLPRASASQQWPDDIVAANWDSMVFDVGRRSAAAGADDGTAARNGRACG